VNGGKLSKATDAGRSRNDNVASMHIPCPCFRLSFHRRPVLGAGRGIFFTA